MLVRELKIDKHKEARIKFAQAEAGHIISLMSIYDDNAGALTYEEKVNRNRWIDRGKELNFRVDPSIFKR